MHITFCHLYLILSDLFNKKKTTVFRCTLNKFDSIGLFKIEKLTIDFLQLSQSEGSKFTVNFYYSFDFCIIKLERIAPLSFKIFFYLFIHLTYEHAIWIYVGIWFCRYEKVLRIVILWYLWYHISGMFIVQKVKFQKILFLKL